jgi:hypothetical protein
LGWGVLGQPQKMIVAPNSQARIWPRYSVTSFSLSMAGQIKDRLANCLSSQGSTIVVFTVGLSTAAFIGLSYWLVCVLVHPYEPVSIRIMYRYEDTDYLPLIYTVARFNVHEFVTLGGAGVLPFPLLFDVPHGAMIALLGDWGFAAADALVMSAWFILFFFIAKVFTKGPRAPAFIGLVMLIAAGRWDWAGVLPADLKWQFGVTFDVWDFRYTRPFVAGLFMLAVILTTQAVMKSLIERATRPRAYAMHGVLLGGSAQGDMHLAIIGCFASAALYTFFIVTRPVDRLSIKAPLVTSAGFALAVLPMAIQYLMGGNAEYTARMGMFPVDRWSPPLYFDVGDAIGLVTILGLWGTISLLARRYASSRSRDIDLLLGAIFLYVVFSILAMPLSASLTGRAFLLYEFHDRRMKFSALGYIVILGLLLVLSYQAWFRKRQDSKRLCVAAKLVFVAVLAGVAISGIWSSALIGADRAATTVQPRVWDAAGWPALPNYRADFEKLATELRGPQYDDTQMLATFDQQLGIWWLAFRKGHLFIPDPLLSNAPDKLIEEATFQLLYLAGASPQFLDDKVNEIYFDVNFFSHDKWQASEAFTYGKIEDYTPAQIEQISRTTILDSWSVLVPRSERERLLAAFTHITAPERLPDMIILPIGTGYDKLGGPGVPYRLAYENTTFRVWLLPPRRDRTFGHLDYPKPGD